MEAEDAEAARSRLGAPRGGFKGWMTGMGLRPERPATAEEAQEIARYRVILMGHLIPGVGLVLAFIFGLLSLLDLIALPLAGHDLRPVLIGHGFVGVVGLAFYGLSQTRLRHQTHAIWLGGWTLVSAVAGVCIAHLGAHSSEYFHLLYWIPISTLGLISSVPARVLGALIIGLAGQVSYLAASWARLSLDHLPLALTTMSAFVGVYIMIGTMITNIISWNGLYRLREQDRNQELARLVEERTRELRELGAHLEEVRDAERQWTAREVHDSLGQELMALRLALNLLRKQDPGGQARLGYLEEITERAQKTLRGIIRRLIPPQLGEVGFVPAIHLLAQEMTRAAEVECVLQCSPLDFSPPEPLAVSLYRALQEALTNVARHGHGVGQVEIQVRQEEAQYVLEVVDDGQPTPSPERSAATSTRFGLLSIRERARNHGGDASWGRTPEGGFQVQMRLPR